MSIRQMRENDDISLSAAFTSIGWNKSAALFRSYLADQRVGARAVLVADQNGICVGYVTVVWDSDYEPFRNAAIPEIVDLNVLPDFQHAGIGNALLDAAEWLISDRSCTAGIGVGLHREYGAAQRIYVRRGYIPDGKGVSYRGTTVAPGVRLPVDDDLVLRFTKELS